MGDRARVRGSFGGRAIWRGRSSAWHRRRKNSAPGSSDDARPENPAKKPRRRTKSIEVAEAFDTMADKVEQMVQGQRELLGAISHELRSPLGRARIALEIARERIDADPKAASRSIGEIDGQLTEVDAILGDLLAVTRAGLTDLQSDTVTLLPWLRGRVAAEAKGGDVELDAEDEQMVGRTAKVDAPLLGRALHNLIANARAHGHPADAPLEVSISYANQKCDRRSARPRTGFFR